MGGELVGNGDDQAVQVARQGGTTDEVAKVVGGDMQWRQQGVAALLLSESAAYMTGQNLLADGGFAGSIMGHIPGLPPTP